MLITLLLVLLVVVSALRPLYWSDGTFVDEGREVHSSGVRISMQGPYRLIMGQAKGAAVLSISDLANYVPFDHDCFEVVRNGALFDHGGTSMWILFHGAPEHLNKIAIRNIIFKWSAGLIELSELHVRLFEYHVEPLVFAERPQQTRPFYPMRIPSLQTLAINAGNIPLDFLKSYFPAALVQHDGAFAQCLSQAIADKLRQSTDQSLGEFYAKLRLAQNPEEHRKLSELLSASNFMQLRHFFLVNRAKRSVYTTIAIRAMALIDDKHEDLEMIDAGYLEEYLSARNVPPIRKAIQIVQLCIKKGIPLPQQAYDKLNEDFKAVLKDFPRQTLCYPLIVEN